MKKKMRAISVGTKNNNFQAALGSNRNSETLLKNLCSEMTTKNAQQFSLLHISESQSKID